jgi:hypothetical protein
MILFGVVKLIRKRLLMALVDFSGFETRVVITELKIKE